MNWFQHEASKVEYVYFFLISCDHKRITSTEPKVHRRVIPRKIPTQSIYAAPNNYSASTATQQIGNGNRVMMDVDIRRRGADGNAIQIDTSNAIVNHLSPSHQISGFATPDEGDDYNWTFETVDSHDSL